MAEAGRYVHNLSKGKDVENSLTGYSNQMLNTSARLSGVRFVLNDATLYGMLYDWEKKEEAVPEKVEEAVSSLQNLVNDFFSGEEFTEALMEEDVSKIDALRSDVTALMDALSLLTDSYTLLEYVSNRKEGNFTDAALPAGYTDEQFCDQLIHWVEQEKDLQQIRLSFLVEELPMRMTKSRFFQILENSLGMYQETDRQSFFDELDMIRSAAILSDQSKAEEDYPALDQTLARLRETDFDQLSSEEFADFQKRMKACGTALNDLTSLVTLLEELINDFYVLILSAPYAMADVSEKEILTDLAKDLTALFLNGRKEEIPEEMNERFTKLEGRQEVLYDNFNSGISAVSDITERYEMQIGKEHLNQTYENIGKIEKLLSDSLFVPLGAEEEDTAICGNTLVLTEYAKLYKEFSDQFAGLSRIWQRAVMSKVLTTLPPFMQTEKEVREYILTSLSGCRDSAEKAASVEILTGLMKED